jgi:hypothetical protein
MRQLRELALISALSMRFPTDVCVAPLTRLTGSSMAPDRDKADDWTGSGFWGESRATSRSGKGEGWLLTRVSARQPPLDLTGSEGLRRQPFLVSVSVLVA